MNPLKKLASQTAVYGLSQILGRFVNYLLVPLYTSLFTTGEYGINTLMYSYVTFFNVLLTYGMETAFFRFSQKSDKPEDVYSTALHSLLVSSIVFGVVCTLTASPLAGLIKIPNHPEYIIIFAWVIALDAFSAVPFAYLRQQNKPLKFAIIKNINIFTNILLNLYFLLLCPWAHQHKGILLPFYGGVINVGLIFMSNLVASIITLPLLWREIMQIKNAAFNKTLWREMLVYGLPLMVVGFAGMINETFDSIVVSYAYPDAQQGLEATGVYGANYKLSILMSLFIQAFRYAAEPFFFSHAKTSDKRSIYAKVMNYFVIICLGLFLLVMLYIDLFRYFINERYWEGLHVVPILLIANMFLGIYYNLSIWYKLSDLTNKGAMISLIGAGITITANLILVPMMGYTGSAWATLFCYVGMAILCYVLGMKYYPIPYQVPRLLVYICAALIIYAVSRSWQQMGMATIVQYVFNSVLLTCFGLVTLWFERRNKIVNSPS